MKNIVCIFILSLFVFSTAQAAERYQIRANPKLVKLSKILMLKSVGVREKTGRNDGDAVESFLRDLGLRKGNPYCAAFQVSCYMRACNALGWSYDSIPFIRSALANSIYVDGKKKGKKTGYKPYDNDFLCWTHHIERVIEVIDDKKVLTVGGNTSGLYGTEGVNIKVRSTTNNLSSNNTMRGLIGI